MQTITTSGRDLVSRWNRALDRAHAAGITAIPVAGKSWFAVSSTDHTVVYMTDRDRCTCAAGQHGDPVCCHRALVREITTPQPEPPAQVVATVEQQPCTHCAASGWQSSRLSNWDAYRCENCDGTGYVPVPAVAAQDRATERERLFAVLDAHNAELERTGRVSNATQRAADAAIARLDIIGYADREVA